MEKRYLVYRSWNGQIHSSIEYGNHTTGEDKEKKDDALKRIELLDHNLTLEQAIKIYPYEKEVIKQ